MRCLQRVGPPKRRKIRYKRLVLFYRDDTGKLKPVADRIIYHCGFYTPRRRTGEGGLPAPLHGGKGLPVRLARSALDTCAISDRNFKNPVPEPRLPYTRATIEKWKRKGWELSGDTFYKDEFDTEKLRTRQPARYARIMAQNSGINHIRREKIPVRIEVYEGMIRAKPILPLVNTPAAAASHRGAITDFTPKSRQRMIERCAQINDKRLGLFVTLTYPDDAVPPSNEATKGHLAAMRKRILRLNEQAGGLWKMEIKERKTGQFQGYHVPHYHLLILGLLGHEKTRKNGRKSQILGLPLLRRWIASAWGEIIGTQDTNFRKAQKVLACTDLTHLQRYIAKYAAKTGDDGAGLDWGKRWDWFGEISFSACITETIDIYEFILLKNQVVNWLLTSGHKGKIIYAAKIMDTEQGFTIYNLGAETIGGDGRRVLAALWSNALGQMV